MVPLIGTHSWDTSTQPGYGNAWVDPFWIMGTYDGLIIDYEPMIPLSFVTGSDDKKYEEDLTYVSQTIAELPSKYTVEYNASNGFVTLSIEGKSAVCNKKKGKKSKKAKKKKNVKGPKKRY